LRRKTVCSILGSSSHGSYYKGFEREKPGLPGANKSVQLQPHENTDPLILEFDEDFCLQITVRPDLPMLAGIYLVVDLLRKIEPYLQTLLVVDEGEYWDTKDIDLLQLHIDNCFNNGQRSTVNGQRTTVTAIDDLKMENEKMDGPFRLQNGRSINLMEEE
jgi:hypothetical protein